MSEKNKEELLRQQKEQQKAEKEQQLSVLPEMERVAILSHEEWVESEGAEGCKMDLRGRDLSKIELTRFNFDKAELSKANLSGTKIYCGSFKEIFAPLMSAPYKLTLSKFLTPNRLAF